MTNDVHVIPTDAPHECSEECWCEPELEYTDDESGRSVWVHKELQ